MLIDQMEYIWSFDKITNPEVSLDTEIPAF